MGDRLAVFIFSSFNGAVVIKDNDDNKLYELSKDGRANLFTSDSGKIYQSYSRDARAYKFDFGSLRIFE